MPCNSKAKSLIQVSIVKTISENKIMLIFYSAADNPSEFLEQTGEIFIKYSHIVSKTVVISLSNNEH